MTSSNDKRLPEDGDLYRRLERNEDALRDSVFLNNGTALEKESQGLLDMVQALLQITRPAGDVAENATTANLSNSTPLPEHFQSFHEVPADNYAVIDGVRYRVEPIVHGSDDSIIAHLFPQETE